jgi:peroxiredoxin
VTTRAQWLVVLAVAGVLVGGLTLATLLVGDELFRVEVGSRAPAMEAVTLDTPPERRTLDDYRGHVVLLNIWATWCVPCEKEMPSMERLHRIYADSGLRIVAVSVDEVGQDEVVREFARRHGLTFEILHDPRREVAHAYGVSGYPESFVIGRDGIIRRKVWYQEWDSPSNRALIAQLLGEGRREVPLPAGDVGPSIPLRGR